MSAFGDSPKWVKSKRRRREKEKKKERKKVGNNNGQLRIAKPPGPKLEGEASIVMVARIWIMLSK